MGRIPLVWSGKDYEYCGCCYNWFDECHERSRKHETRAPLWESKSLKQKIEYGVEALAEHAGEATGVVQFGKLLLEGGNPDAMACFQAITGITQLSIEQAQLPQARRRNYSMPSRSAGGAQRVQLPDPPRPLPGGRPPGSFQAPAELAELRQLRDRVGALEQHNRNLQAQVDVLQEKMDRLFAC